MIPSPQRKAPILVLSLAMGGLFTGPASAEHTINRADSTDFVLERTVVEVLDPETATPASCIALPDGWAAPSVVTFSGNHLISSTNTPFSVTGTRYTDGESVISGFQALDAYTWYCYQDSASRNIDDSTEVNVRFELTTSETNTVVFTSVGTIEGVPARRSVYDYFYENIQSYQIIENDEAADYFARIDIDLGDNFTSYSVFEVDNTLYYLDRNGFSFSIDGDDQIQFYNTPDNAEAHYINGQFIFMISEGDPDIQDMAIQFGSDLNNLSPIHNINYVGLSANNLSYESNTNQYVLINPGTSVGENRAYYRSNDLITWIADPAMTNQALYLALSDTTTALISTTSTVQNLMYRDTQGAWQFVTDYPSDQKFFGQGLLFAQDRFYALMTESSLATSEPLSMTIGHSQDAQSWTWTTLTTDQDTIYSNNNSEVFAFGENKMAIIIADLMFLSFDQGVTWSNAISPLSALGLDAGVDNSEFSLVLEDLIHIDGTFYGSAKISNDRQQLSYFIFKTQDGSQFDLVHRGEKPLLSSHNGKLYFYEAGDSVYKDTPATIPEPDSQNPNEQESDGSSSSSGFGGLPLYILVLFGLLVRRKTK